MADAFIHADDSAGWDCCTVPQKPVSSPTEKQLLSLLKAADREIGPADSSMTCRVFIVVTEIQEAGLMCEMET